MANKKSPAERLCALARQVHSARTTTQLMDLIEKIRAQPRSRARLNIMDYAIGKISTTELVNKGVFADDPALRREAIASSKKVDTKLKKNVQYLCRHLPARGQRGTKSKEAWKLWK